MATVTSLTEEKIKELLGGYEGVALSQDQINALAVQLATRQAELDATMEQLNNVTLPQLATDLSANSAQVSNLNDSVLPDLDAALAENAAIIENLNTVTIPELQLNLDNGIENIMTIPQTYFQDEPPTGPDPDDPDDPDAPRELQVNDVWHDTNDGNKQYRWDGTQWTTFAIDIPDLSLTVKKFKTSTHMIY